MANTYFSAEDLNNEIYHFDDGTHGIQKIGYPDLITPINGSVVSFTYPGVPEAKGVAGVSYKTTYGGMEYLAFPIEAVYKDSERKDLLNDIFQHYSNLLSVDESFIKTNIRLYPNPTRGFVEIANPNFLKIKEVEVFNIYGNKLDVQWTQNRIDFHNFPKGIYIIKIDDQKGRQGVFKMLKK